MARPKRNLVEEIQTKIFIFYVCELLGIKPTGSDLSMFFEGHKRSSSKWKRYLYGTKTPSPGTLMLMFEKIDSLPGSDEFSRSIKELWYSSLWIALKAGEQTNGYWTEFYKTLPIRLQKHVFVANVHSGNPYDRRYPRQNELSAIEKISDLNTLAFFIGLTRDAAINNKGISIHGLDVALYRLFFAFCQHIPFNPFALELWHYFKRHVILQDRRAFEILRRNRWQESDAKVIEIIQLDADLINIARQIGLVSTPQEVRQFLHFFYTNKPEKIYLEIEQYQQQEQCEFTRLNELIRKLNTLRTSANKIPYPLSTHN